MSVFRFRIRHTFSEIEHALRNNKSLNENKIEANLGMFTLMTLLAALQGQGTILLSWLNRMKLVRFMNDWIQLRRDIRVQLRANNITTHDENSSGNVMKYYAVGLFAIIYISVHVICASIVISLAPQHPDRTLEVVHLTLIAGYFGFSGALLDAKFLLILNELKDSYSQVINYVMKPF